MAAHDPMTTLKAEIVEYGEDVSLARLCATCGVSPDWVMSLVRHGGLMPRGRRPRNWRFSATAIVRVNRARRLSRDLELDPAATAVVLDLIDEIDRLRARLDRLREPGR